MIVSNGLSWKAIGLLNYISEDSNVSLEKLQSISKDKRESIRAGIKELIENGYLEVVQKRNSTGFNGCEYRVIK